MNWVKTASGKLAMLVALVTSLAFFGLDLSGFRPAWAYEHQALAADFYASRCETLLNEYARARIEDSRIQRATGKRDQYMIAYIIRLEREMTRIGCVWSRG